jgi:hypothetical protein
LCKASYINRSKVFVGDLLSRRNLDTVESTNGYAITKRRFPQADLSNGVELGSDAFPSGLLLSVSPKRSSFTINFRNKKAHCDPTVTCNYVHSHSFAGSGISIADGFKTQ